jgi:3-methyladenine DNA glycosylase Mpg
MPREIWWEYYFFWEAGNVVFYNCSSGYVVVNNAAVNFGILQSVLLNAVLILGQSRKLRRIATRKIKQLPV